MSLKLEQPPAGGKQGDYLPFEAWRDFLEVMVSWKLDGRMVPLSFIWNDREYRIDQVTECQSGSGLKEVRPGTRYTCRLGQKQFYLYFDDIQRKWYIERKKGGMMRPAPS